MFRAFTFENAKHVGRRAWHWVALLPLILAAPMVVALAQSPSLPPQDSKRFHDASSREAMHFLAGLQGTWRVTLSCYDSASRTTVPTDSDMVYTCASHAGSTMLQSTWKGTLDGRPYDGTCSLYYDVNMGKYRVVLADCVIRTPLTLTGDLIDWEPGQYRYADANGTVCLKTFTEDSSAVYTLFLYSRDSAAWKFQDASIIDSLGEYRTLAQFTLKRP